jgi:Arc/MetJ family transcription regulator
MPSNILQAGTIVTAGFALLCMLMRMRTTLIIDENLFERAAKITGIRQKTALVRAGLEALIAREAGRRLAALAGAEPALCAVPRRRTRTSRP